VTFVEAQSSYVISATCSGFIAARVSQTVESTAAMGDIGIRRPELVSVSPAQGGYTFELWIRQRIVHSGLISILRSEDIGERR
jgi:hypothetical protein